MLYSVVIDHEAKQVDLFKSGDTFQRSALDEVVVEATVDGLDSSDTLIVRGNHRRYKIFLEDTLISPAEAEQQDLRVDRLKKVTRKERKWSWLRPFVAHETVDYYESTFMVPYKTTVPKEYRLHKAKFTIVIHEPQENS